MIEFFGSFNLKISAKENFRLSKILVFNLLRIFKMTMIKEIESSGQGLTSNFTCAESNSYLGRLK